MYSILFYLNDDENTTLRAESLSIFLIQGDSARKVRKYTSIALY